MAFDPVTLLTIILLLSVSLGGVLIRMSFAEQNSLALRGWGVGLLISGLGVALTLLSPGGEQTLLRTSGLALVIVAHAVFWGSARAFTGRPVRLAIMLAGPLLWCAVLPLDLAVPWRITITSCIRAAYAFAIVAELRDSHPEAWTSQRWTVLLFAMHGAFLILRAVLGGPVEILWPTADLAPALIVVSSLETILFVGIFGVLAVLLSRETMVQAHRRAAEEDVLTGIGNRRALGTAWDRLARCGAPETGPRTALLLMDLDGFKSVNDRHGHEAGDRMLSAFAQLVRERLPASGQVFRIGGEEFVALLQDAGPIAVRAIAEDLRQSFGRISIDGPGGPVRTTVSIGIAQAWAGKTTVSDLLRRADRQLYIAKAEGRDRVVADAEDPSAERLEPAIRAVA